jgi:hypothetical protein
VLASAAISGDGIHMLVEAVRRIDAAALREGVPRCLRYGFAALAPPSQLAHVCEDDARGRGPRLDMLNQGDCRAFADAARAADDAMGQDAEILGVLIEENDDARLMAEVARDEDGKLGGFGRGIKRD